MHHFHSCLLHSQQESNGAVVSTARHPAKAVPREKEINPTQTYTKYKFLQSLGIIVYPVPVCTVSCSKRLHFQSSALQISFSYQSNPQAEIFTQQ